MLSRTLVAEIKRLLSEDRLSQRKIALRVGVSRSTVNAIAAGRRRESPPGTDTLDEPVGWPQGPLERCPGCGGLMTMPCLLCHIRAWQRIEGPVSGPLLLPVAASGAAAVSRSG